jgi:hypothetical protein
VTTQGVGYKRLLAQDLNAFFGRGSKCLGLGLMPLYALA